MAAGNAGRGGRVMQMLWPVPVDVREFPQAADVNLALGKLNGATRFYGPYSGLQGGAYMDMGNAYLQKNSIDIQPEEGRLVLFPSWLPHKAMAYEGSRDRIIVSFNLQIHSRAGNQLHAYAAA